jgi:hypothetical protein
MSLIIGGETMPQEPENRKKTDDERAEARKKFYEEQEKRGLIRIRVDEERFADYAKYIAEIPTPKGQKRLYEKLLANDKFLYRDGFIEKITD